MIDCCFCVVKGWLLGSPGEKGIKVHCEESEVRENNEWEMGVGLSSPLGVGLSSPVGQWAIESCWVLGNWNLYIEKIRNRGLNGKSIRLPPDDFPFEGGKRRWAT